MNLLIRPGPFDQRILRSSVGFISRSAMKRDFCPPSLRLCKVTSSSISILLEYPGCAGGFASSFSLRNFWLSTGSFHWSISGQSAWQKALPKGKRSVNWEAGFLWQKVKRSNKKLGLEATVTSFVPAGESKLEIMLVDVKNISRKSIQIKATSAIPLFGRSADNLRDHRHVSSLLNRVSLHSHGIILKPTMSFNERGHLKNNISYFVTGSDENGGAPIGMFPTMASFIGEGGSLGRPAAVFENLKPQKKILENDNGQEAMGALQFKPVRLAPGKSTSYILLLGIDRTSDHISAWFEKFKTRAAVLSSLQETNVSWRKEVSRVEFMVTRL